MRAPYPNEGDISDWDSVIQALEEALSALYLANKRLEEIEKNGDGQKN